MKSLIPFLREDSISTFDNYLDHFFNETFSNFSDNFGLDFFEKSSYPKLDIIDYVDKCLIESEIPGLKKDDISIEIKDNILSISGKKQDKKEENNKGVYLYRELKKSSFKRSINIDSKKYNLEQINASFENGILKIEIPKIKIEEDKNNIKVVNIK